MKVEEWRKGVQKEIKKLEKRGRELSDKILENLQSIEKFEMSLSDPIFNFKKIFNALQNFEKKKSVVTDDYLNFKREIYKIYKDYNLSSVMGTHKGEMSQYHNFIITIDNQVGALYAKYQDAFSTKKTELNHYLTIDVSIIALIISFFAILLSFLLS